jgi:hypothetical protein
MKDIEDYREVVIDDLFRNSSFNAAWSVWKTKIDILSDSMSDPVKVFELGSHLREIFFLTKTEKTQGDVNRAGEAWEALISWFLNTIFSGSRGIVIKKKAALIPQCISNSISINYGSDQTNSESDLVVIIFPKDFTFPTLGCTMNDLSMLIAARLHDFEIGVIQCKTNWNENAQIPMLWDMVYRAKGFSDGNISIGKKSHSVEDVQKFTYSFVTVPTQKSEFKPTHMPVRRVRSLSGGNYWGKPTTNGVSWSLNEIFSKNYKSAFDKPIQQSISGAILNKTGVFSKH